MAADTQQWPRRHFLTLLGIRLVILIVVLAIAASRAQYVTATPYIVVRVHYATYIISLVAAVAEILALITNANLYFKGRLRPTFRLVCLYAMFSVAWVVMFGLVAGMVGIDWESIVQGSSGSVIIVLYFFVLAQVISSVYMLAFLGFIRGKSCHLPPSPPAVHANDHEAGSHRQPELAAGSAKELPSGTGQVQHPTTTAELPQEQYSRQEAPELPAMAQAPQMQQGPTQDTIVINGVIFRAISQLDVQQSQNETYYHYPPIAQANELPAGRQYE